MCHKSLIYLLFSLNHVISLAIPRKSRKLEECLKLKLMVSTFVFMATEWSIDVHQLGHARGRPEAWLGHEAFMGQINWVHFEHTLDVHLMIVFN